MHGSLAAERTVTSVASKDFEVEQPMLQRRAQQRPPSPSNADSQACGAIASSPG